MTGNQTPPYPPLDRFDARIDELLSRMTLPEKIGQLCQLNGPGTPSDEQRKAVAEGRVGSFLNASGEPRNELQRIAVEESRLGIPLIFGRDVIHGYRTIFPIPVAQASSFDPELVERAAAVAANEASAHGVDWTFAPMIDVTRDPRWGRIAEGPGEDPYLAAELGAAMVRGFQGPDLTDPTRVAACAKHFAGYGASESGKDYNTTYIPEQLLRELYLAPFEACVNAGVLTLMSAFNDLNGVPASGNAFTLRQVLREEWGFRGLVVSDWASITEMVMHGYAETEREAALAGVTAGVDMEMATSSYSDHLQGLVEGGALASSKLDECVRHVLRVKLALGLFENPYRTIDDSRLLSAEHRAIARELAAESMVLLKNESGALPLREGAQVAVVGSLADSGIDHNGCWAYDGRAEDTVTSLAALRERLGDRVSYTPGLATPRSTERDGFAAAVEAVRAADVALVFVGEDWALAGEARCRAFLNLPGAQEALIDALAETGTPLVLVVMSGRPLTLGPVLGKASAVLWAWNPGTMGGPALADLVTGARAPSGKLPVTFPRAVGQIPIYYAKKNGGRPPKADTRGVPLGSPLDPTDFSIMHMDVEQSPEFPFGFGLSYTTFEYGKLELSSDALRGDERLGVSFEIENSGGISGTEVVQLYIRDLVASITRPVRELKRFARVSLAAGEARRVDFTLTREDLSFVGAEMKRVVEPGRFQIFVGGSSSATLSAEFTLLE